VCQSEQGKQRSDAALQWTETTANEEINANTENPEANDSREARSNQAVTGEKLSSTGGNVKERRVEIDTVQNSGPSGAKAGQPAQQNCDDLIEPKGLKGGTKERVGEVECRDQQECDHDDVTRAVLLRVVASSDARW